MRKIETEELKKIEQEILDNFVKVCNENGLTYFISGGSLIGALRHKGFIPWDDDIDVIMPRKDYEKLFEILPLGGRYEIRDIRNTQNYPFPFANFNDTRTFKKELKLRKKYGKCLCVNIDVFPIDNVPESQEEIERLYRSIGRMGTKLQCVTYKFGKGQGPFKTIRKNLGILYYRILELLGISSVEKVVKEFIEVGTQYNDTESTKCGVTLIAHYGSKEVNVKADYLPAVKVTFESKEYYAPKCYDTYLTNLYGNYMSMPPKEFQKTHHTSDCYWK